MKVINKFFRSIFNVFNKAQKVQENACPNCWGWQEYDGEVRLTGKQTGVRKGWIQEYISKYIKR
ncbi:MAG: hypothetical protein KJO50_00360 [Bacteroidia bacterium]|nr:hypothetical protein [Bacteroidia bacterium]